MFELRKGGVGKQKVLKSETVLNREEMEDFVSNLLSRGVGTDFAPQVSASM